MTTKIHVTENSFRWQWKWNGLLKAIKSIFTGVDWDTRNPLPFWTFKKGEQFDYTNAKLIIPPLRIVEGAYTLFGLAPVKPEGYPIRYDSEESYWEGHTYLGTWWSVKFRTRWFHIYYRHRSWTKDIFYITKD